MPRRISLLGAMRTSCRYMRLSTQGILVWATWLCGTSRGRYRARLAHPLLQFETLQLTGSFNEIVNAISEDRATDYEIVSRYSPVTRLTKGTRSSNKKVSIDEQPVR
jgi:hypothetical protein